MAYKIDFKQLVEGVGIEDVARLLGLELKGSNDELRCRLNRDMKNRFGSEGYAMEELVAELGSAFQCAKLGIEAEPRLDHAQYISNWLKVLKSDKRAIFSASAKAQEAVTFLGGHHE